MVFPLHYLALSMRRAIIYLFIIIYSVSIGNVENSL